jgi:hypothetical protein
MTRIAAEIWSRSAACAGITWQESDKVFFPVSENQDAVAKARSLFCDRCPLMTDCLNDALASDRTGLWAGTTADSRRKLRRTRHRAKCPLCLATQVVTLEETTGYDSELCLACGVSWATDARPADRSPTVLEAEQKVSGVVRDARSGRVLSAATA